MFQTAFPSAAVDFLTILKGLPGDHPLLPKETSRPGLEK